MPKQKSPNDGHPHRKAMERIIVYLQPGVACEIYRSPKMGDAKGFLGPSKAVGRVYMNAKRQLWFDRELDGAKIHLAGGRDVEASKPVQDG